MQWIMTHFGEIRLLLNSKMLPEKSSHIKWLFFTRTVNLFGIHPVCFGVLKRMDILQMGSVFDEFIHAEDLGDR